MTGTIRDVTISVEVIEQDGTHRNVVFPISPADEILLAMIDHRRIAYEEKWAGGSTFNSIG